MTRARAGLVALITAPLVLSLLLLGQPARGVTARSGGAASASTCLSARDGDFAEGLSRVVAAAIDASARGHGTPVSFAFYDRVRDTTCYAGADVPYYQASTVKVAILAALLHERRAHPAPHCAAGVLCGQERSRAEVMIRVSDNAAANFLYARAGGPAGLRRFLRLEHMDDTHPAGPFGDTVTTAADQLILLRSLTAHNDLLTDAQRAYVLDLMATVRRTRLLWFGVPYGAPAGTTVGDKIGLNAWRDSKRSRVHSIGVVRGGGTAGCPGYDYMMALLSQNNPNFVAGADRLDRVAGAVNGYLRAHPPACAQQPSEDGGRPSGDGQ
jgi:hypothetical protein